VHPFFSQVRFSNVVGLVYPFRNTNSNERRITMTYQDHCTLLAEFSERIAADGVDALPELIRILFDAAMPVERQQNLGARPYERSPARRGGANGLEPAMISTRMGEITCAVLQVREGGFQQEALEKGQRSEPALTSAHQGTIMDPQA
jgi:transposase-like protein